jgi:transcriptional regulator with XRE-family HTH domain
MDNVNKTLIKKNLFTLLDYSGLTDINFANLLGVSDKQIKRIKKSEAEFSIDNINKACDFFHKSLANINNKEIDLSFNYRDKLTEFHKSNSEYSAFLQNRPTINYAINFELLNNPSFLRGKLEVKSIKQIFKERGWVFASSYISLAMQRNIILIKTEPHPTKKGIFVYSKK